MTKKDLLSRPIILALDTSSKATSLAVARGETLLNSAHDLPDQKRSETLWLEIKSLLDGVEKTIHNVDLFAVCTGPGGFTGLRVGISAVKGFSTASSKPVAGITSLEATAFAALPAKLVCAIVNAYKHEVYSQTFEFDEDGVPIARNEPLVSTLEKALDRVTGEVSLIFAGDGVEAGAREIDRVAAASGRTSWIANQQKRGLAEAIAGLAYVKYVRGEFQTISDLKACYVRPSEAEIKLSLGLLGSKIKRSMKP